MNDVDLRQLDLNLLVTLDALLETSSVTRAAARLGVGQPATSHALGKLRDLFGDPLLVRAGRGMALTPRARALQAIRGLPLISTVHTPQLRALQP